MAGFDNLPARGASNFPCRNPHQKCSATGLPYDFNYVPGVGLVGPGCQVVDAKGLAVKANGFCCAGLANGVGASGIRQF